MEVPRLWRQQPSNLRLEGSRCRKCQTLFFPERILCSKCLSDDIEKYRLGGTGTLLASTVVYEAPFGFAGQVPYVAGIIRTKEGPVVSAVITDVNPEDVHTGMKLEMVTRRIGDAAEDDPILYGYKFVPAK